jgi:hypothetical protein
MRSGPRAFRDRPRAEAASRRVRRSSSASGLPSLTATSRGRGAIGASRRNRRQLGESDCTQAPAAAAQVGRTIAKRQDQQRGGTSRGVLGCMELGSAGSTAAFPRMQERHRLRSRPGGRLHLVHTASEVVAAEGTRRLLHSSRSRSVDLRSSSSSGANVVGASAETPPFMGEGLCSGGEGFEPSSTARSPRCARSTLSGPCLLSSSDGRRSVLRSGASSNDRCTPRPRWCFRASSAGDRAHPSGRPRRIPKAQPAPAA